MGDIWLWVEQVVDVGEREEEYGGMVPVAPAVPEGMYIPADEVPWGYLGVIVGGKDDVAAGVVEDGVAVGESVGC